jgi:PAS domain S-box-containing protein
VKPTVAWSSEPGWREFFDLLSDAVIVLDDLARVVFANTAALRLLPCEPGLPIEHLQPSLGAGAIAWVRLCLIGEATGPPPADIWLADGRSVVLNWRRLDEQRSALRLATSAPAASRGPSVWPADSMREAIAFLWESPFPALLQGPDFLTVDANPAFVEMTGHARDALVGHDPIHLQPDDDRPRTQAARERIRAAVPGRLPEPGLIDARIVDASRRERRVRVLRRTMVDAFGAPLYLAVFQDATAEHLARERADSSLRELEDWFDLSPVGMVLLDERGLLLRSNPAFFALTGCAPTTLADAPADLRVLLGGDAEGLCALEPESVPVQRQGSVSRVNPGGGARLLRSVLRCYRSAGGRRRYMAVLEDRSADDARELAQLQIGAMMDTAGLGLATFQEASGGVLQAHAGTPGGEAPANPGAALQNIGRELVLPSSLPEFERLQLALRQAERAEVRYAIRHPELGERWLLTRVEPATLASGTRTTSVVTLDITEQHRTRQRTGQLLHELATILESSSAGIAYLRGDRVVRCNRRFESMLGLQGGAATGQTIQELFAGSETTARVVIDAWQALAEGSIYETEFDLPPQDGHAARWVSLSVRRASAPSGGLPETIALLADISRLKSQQQQLEVLARDRELMFTLSGVGIAFLRDGRIQRGNQALAQLAGCSVDALVDLPLIELFADAAEFGRRWPSEEANLRQYGRWTGERPLRARDGRLLWVQVSKRLVTEGDPGGGIIATYVNVDARYRAERAVALQAGRTRAILDSALVGIVTVGPQGIEWMNRSARRMFGGELIDFVNLPIATVAPPGAGHPFLRVDDLTELAEGQAETFECRVRARDGREFWVVGNVVCTARESTGRQLTYALLDVERRRQAEAQLSQAQLQLQRVIEAAPLAITLRDAATLKVLQMNALAAANRGSTPEALIGLTPEQLYDPATAAARRRDMESALASREVSSHEYRREHAGEVQVWDARYVPLSTRPGEPPDQLLVVATDVTEQRAAQEARLEAAIAQREMLVKEVHHRIKNNLQGVAGLLQQIGQRKPEMAGPIAEVVGQVQAIAQVYGLQVGAGGPLRLVNVVEAITQSVVRNFGRTISFEANGSAPAEWLLPEAEAIPIALTLNELLTNAVKHSPGATAAALGCALVSASGEVTITITNPGRLASAFSLAGIPGGVSGLGLVRALLPRRSATLTLLQAGDRVVTTVALRPPAVQREAATPPNAPEGEAP